jgi:hypothetical protein
MSDADARALLIDAEAHGVRPVFCFSTHSRYPCGSLPSGLQTFGPIAERDVAALVEWLRASVGLELDVQVVPVTVTETARGNVMHVEVEPHGGCALAVMGHRPAGELLICAYRHVEQILFVTMPRTRDVFHAFSLVADGTLRELGERRAATVFACSLEAVDISDEAPSPADLELVERALGVSCAEDGARWDHASAMGRGRLAWALLERMGASLWFERAISLRPHRGSSDEFETLAIVWTDAGALALHHERDTDTLQLCEDQQVVAAVRRISSDILRRRQHELDELVLRGYEPNPFAPGPYGVYASGDPVLCQPYARWMRAPRRERAKPDLTTVPESLRVYLLPRLRKKLEAG